MTTQTYHVASRKFLAQAREELAAGDVSQASEKGWGAAAQMVTAIAAQRGWEHRKHALLFDAVARLVDEVGDDDIDRLFAVANSLHINFYEDWQNAQSVERHLNDVARLLDKLEPLLTR